MKTFVLAGAAIAALAAVPALAQAGGESRARFAHPQTRAAVESQVRTHFAKLDSNRDGFVTQEEARAQVAAARAERQAHRGQRRAEVFARLDANGDGSISRAEFDARPDRGERSERRAHRAERRGDRAERRAGRMEHRGQRMGRGGLAARFGARAFQAMDANSDGRVSLTEASARALARFDRADANRDGTISAEERAAVRALRQERRGN